ncbi:transporter substrate-binding domain-containing protein [Mycolicibacterium sp. XJ1904]
MSARWRTLTATALWVVLLGALAGAVPRALAEPEPGPDPRPVSVAVHSLEPFVMPTGGGELTGFSVDLWEEVAKRLNWSTEYLDSRDVSGQLTDVAEGRAEVATLTVAKLDAKITGPADLYDKRVATVAGTTAASFLQGMGIDSTETSTIEDSYHLLREDGYDAVVFDAPVLRYYVAHRGEGVAVMAGPVFREEDQGFVTKLDSPLRKPINQTLFRIREDGTYNLLKEKWFGDDVATTAGDLN